MSDKMYAHRWTGINEGYTVVNDMCLVHNKV